MNIYLGENIKRLRREKDITQETLAEFLGVTFQSISKWERGESYPDITLLPAIAGFFSVSIDELMGVGKAQDEEEIKRLLQEHDNFTDTKLILKAITNLKEKYPTDFRVQLRWMGYLIFMMIMIPLNSASLRLCQYIRTYRTTAPRILSAFVPRGIILIL